MMGIKSWLSDNVSGKRLSLFRILFGISMCYEIVDYFKIKLIEVGILQPSILFHFSPFGAIGPLPSAIFKIILGLMLIAAILITVGYRTKPAAAFFSVAYLYIIFLEKAYYNNHLYLFALIAFLFSIIDSEEHYSLTKKINMLPARWIPRWHLALLQWQIVMVYFYGGVAKLSADWIVRLEPINTTRNTISNEVWYSFIKSDGGLKFFMYGGLVLDLIFSLLLFHKKLKWIAIPAIIVFNFMNSKIFNDIGVFPYVMLCAMVLFITTDDIRKILPSVGVTDTSNWQAFSKTSKWLQYLMAGYIIFHSVMPFRGHIFSKNMDWTGIHQSFSWRMKSMHREFVEMKWVVVNGQTKESIPITHEQLINNLQVEVVGRNAEAVLQFARFLKAEAVKRNIASPRVYAKIIVKFNGRPAQPFVKPDIDLSSDSYHIGNTEKWLTPLAE
jgi:vitamin K-dependent gamma-carboxylase